MVLEAIGESMMTIGINGLRQMVRLDTASIGSPSSAVFFQVATGLLKFAMTPLRGTKVAPCCTAVLQPNQINRPTQLNISVTPDFGRDERRSM